MNKHLLTSEREQTTDQRILPKFNLVMHWVLLGLLIEIWVRSFFIGAEITQRQQNHQNPILSRVTVYKIRSLEGTAHLQAAQQIRVSFPGNSLGLSFFLAAQLVWASSRQPSLSRMLLRSLTASIYFLKEDPSVSGGFQELPEAFHLFTFWA